MKIFTAKEANQTLPLVRKIVEDILKTGRCVRDLAAQMGSKAEESPEMIKLSAQMEELFDELEAIGCSYKDWNFETGLVDFPGVIGGKEVCLCWRSDEKELQYYHEVDAGFAGRKLIPQELSLRGA